MGDPSKRFIKKIPQSGASPVFKLTLPHATVHDHLAHLIDKEFEIATSPDAVNFWQGTIAPRRNKNRSEYTLQGWRLFAEAHGVQTGDQVSFELVNPRRLVVKVMSTEEAKLVTGSSRMLSGATEHEETQDSDEMRPVGGFGHGHGQGSMMIPLIQEQSAEKIVDRMLEDPPSYAARSMESRYPGQETEDQQMKKFKEFLSSGPAAARPPAFGPSTQARMGGHGGPRADFGDMSPRESIKTPTKEWEVSQSPQQSGRLSVPPFHRPPEPGGMTTSEPYLFSTPSGDWNLRSPLMPTMQNPNAIQNQMLELRATIQAQQASLHYLETKARRAEYEASQIKLYYSEVHLSMSKQTRHMIKATDNMEALINRMSSPELLDTVHPSSAETIVKLQAELSKQLHGLKTCLLNLMNLDI